MNKKADGAKIEIKFALFRWLDIGLGFAVALVSVRYLFGCIQTSGLDALPAVALAIGGFACGVYSPFWSGLILVFSIPALGGTEFIGLWGETKPLPTLTAGILVGSTFPLTLRHFYPLLNGTQRGPLTGKPQQLILISLFAAVVVSSTVLQMCQLPPAELSRDLAVSEIGFSQPTYFFVTCQLWLQGIGLYRLLSSHKIKRANWSAINLLAPILVLLPFLAQLIFHVPAKEEAAPLGYYSPFEDISSFGSVACILLALQIGPATWDARFSFARVGTFVATLAMLICSWSRAAWAAGGAILFLGIFLRTSRLISLLLTGIVIVAVVAANLAPRPLDNSHLSYLGRAISLVRYEPFSNKSPERVFIYHKAWEMIRARPLVGHGAGSFYMQSVRFAAANDPRAAVPNFAHNVFLQLACELGIPAACLFVIIIVYSLFWPENRFLVPAPANKIVRRGCILSLLAYIATQLTANSLNVYLSNQLIFWTLLWMTTYSASDPQPNVAERVYSVV